jgi:hypothetical protein
MWRKRERRSSALPIFGNCIGEYSEEVEMWRKRDSRSIGLPIFGSCIGEYSEEVDMWRKRRDVVQASQYSATILTGSVVRGRRGRDEKKKK